MEFSKQLASGFQTKFRVALTPVIPNLVLDLVHN